METGVAAVTSIRCFGLGDVAQNSESLCFHGLPLTQLPHTTVLCVQGDRTRDKTQTNHVPDLIKLNYTSMNHCVEIY